MRKEELRHDPIRENIVKSIEYIKENQNTVLKIFAGLIFLIGGLSYYKYMGTEKLNNASNVAGLAQNSFINGEIDEAMVKFERVLDDYPSTSGATQSLVYLLNNAVTQGDYEMVSNLIAQHKGSIEDPTVQAYLYKIQGDRALYEERVDDALSFYRKAENSSKDSASKIKYKLDLIMVLLTMEDYSHVREILEDILEYEDVGYNEKNKAEELIAFVNQKLGT